MRFWTLMIGVSALAASSAAAAGAQNVVEAPPAPIEKLLGCRALNEAAARLSCFDREIGAVAGALERRDLVAIDREKIRSTRRSLFGLSLPKFALFGDDEADEVKQVDSVVTGIGRNRDAGYVFVLENGGRWSQTDGNPIAVEPRRGDKVVVKRGALGSYMLSVAGQPGVKVLRVN